MTAHSTMAVFGPSLGPIVQVLTEGIKGKTPLYRELSSFPRSRLITILQMQFHLRFQKEVWLFCIALLCTTLPRIRLLPLATRTLFTSSMAKPAFNIPPTIGFKDQSIIHFKLLRKPKKIKSGGSGSFPALYCIPLFTIPETSLLLPTRV